MIYDFLDHRERVLDDESIEPPTGMQILGLLDSLEIAAYDLMDSFSEGFDKVSYTVSKEPPVREVWSHLYLLVLYVKHNVFYSVSTVSQEPQCARFSRVFTCPPIF